MSVIKDEILKVKYQGMTIVDEVMDINKGSDIHAIKRLTGEEDYFRGHFPNNPVMPGVIIIEALAQASGILGFQTNKKKPDQIVTVFAGVDKR